MSDSPVQMDFSDDIDNLCDDMDSLMDMSDLDDLPTAIIVTNVPASVFSDTDSQVFINFGQVSCLVTGIKVGISCLAMLQTLSTFASLSDNDMCILHSQRVSKMINRLNLIMVYHALLFDSILKCFLICV